MVLNEFGQIVHARILPLMDDADRLDDEILAANGILVGEVHVGLLPSSVPALAGRLFRVACG